MCVIKIVSSSCRIGVVPFSLCRCLQAGADGCGLSFPVQAILIILKGRGGFPLCLKQLIDVGIKSVGIKTESAQNTTQI